MWNEYPSSGTLRVKILVSQMSLGARQQKHLKMENGGQNRQWLPMFDRHDI